jgi:hypothetical protein
MLKISTLVLANLAYPELRPGVIGSICGYHEGDYIVSLQTPLADGSQAAVVRNEAIALMPEQVVKTRAARATKAESGTPRGYDNSLRDARKCVKDLNGVTVNRNAATDGKGNRVGLKFRVFANDATLSSAAQLKFGDYDIDRVSLVEFTCEPSVVTESDDSETEESVTVDGTEIDA